MQVALCQDDTVATLTAPAGFLYEWNTGDTTNSITVPNPVTGAQYWVKITSYNGCTDTIFAMLTYTVVTTDFNYTATCATLPCQFHDASTVNQNLVADWEWDFGDGSPIITHNPNPDACLSGTWHIPGQTHLLFNGRMQGFNYEKHRHRFSSASDQYPALSADLS